MLLPHAGECVGERLLKLLAKTIALKPSMIAFLANLLMLRDIGSHFGPVISTRQCRRLSSSILPGRRLLVKNN